MSTKKAPMRQKNDKKSAHRPQRGENITQNDVRRHKNPSDRAPQNRGAKGASFDRSPPRGSDRARGDSLRAPNNSYFLWGHHALAAALANQNRRIKALYATQDGRDKLIALISALPADRANALPDIRAVERHQLDHLPQAGSEGGKVVHQGIVAAVAPLDNPHLDDFLEETTADDSRPQRLMVLDQVSDPRNVGAILRSARAFGTSALIMQDRHAPEETGGLARTAVGALEEVTIIRVVNLARALDTLKDYHFHIAGLDMEGSHETSRAAHADRLALVMGSEGKGMRRLTAQACDEILAIAMADSSESLNVSVAAAIMMHSTQAVK